MGRCRAAPGLLRLEHGRLHDQRRRRARDGRAGRAQLDSPVGGRPRGAGHQRTPVVPRAVRRLRRSGRAALRGQGWGVRDLERTERAGLLHAQARRGGVHRPAQGGLPADQGCGPERHRGGWGARCRHRLWRLRDQPGVVRQRDLRGGRGRVLRRPVLPPLQLRDPVLPGGAAAGVTAEPGDRDPQPDDRQWRCEQADLGQRVRRAHRGGHRRSAGGLPAGHAHDVAHARVHRADVRALVTGHRHQQHRPGADVRRHSLRRHVEAGCLRHRAACGATQYDPRHGAARTGDAGCHRGGRRRSGLPHPVGRDTGRRHRDVGGRRSSGTSRDGRTDHGGTRGDDRPGSGHGREHDRDGESRWHADGSLGQTPRAKRFRSPFGPRRWVSRSRSRPRRPPPRPTRHRPPSRRPAPLG